MIEDYQGMQTCLLGQAAQGNARVTEDSVLRRALLRIVGDKPMPYEDSYERCRQMAAGALGYEIPEPMDMDIDLVPHGELAAIKERDEARAEIVTLKAELVTLRARVSERDASIVNAIRTGRSFRHV